MLQLVDGEYQGSFERVPIAESAVLSISSDVNDVLLIGTMDGLYYEKSRSPWEFEKIAEGSHQDICLDNNDNIWSGTNDGLYLLQNTLEGAAPTFVTSFQENVGDPGSLNKNLIKSLFKDKTGIIWIGMNGGGINKFDSQRKNFQHVKRTLEEQSLTYDKIRSIFEDSHGTLWIGTEGGGLNRLQKEDDNGGYKRFDHIKSASNVFALGEVTSGNERYLLIGSEDQPSLRTIDLSQQERNINVQILSDIEIGSVFSIIQDRNGIVWIGTYFEGLYRWDPKTSKKTSNFHRISDNTGLPSNIIRNIYEDSKGNIWVGTGNGLSKLTPDEALKENPTFAIYQSEVGNQETISHNYVLPIYESSNGNLWIGTFGGGLNKFDRESEKFKVYTEKDGLSNNVVKGIQEDAEGNLWISTNKGLTKFDPEREVFKNYDVNDGLQSDEFQELASFKRRSGEMIFGGVNGFNSFFPNEISDNPEMAKVVLTDFYIFNKSIGPNEKFNGRNLLETSISKTKKLELKYYESSFSFDFAALHYAAPNKNQYKYKLEGFDENWTYANFEKRFATYTNISPGEYELRLKASNNDNLWNETYESIAITIKPPFWRTNLAYIVYFVLGVVFLWSLRRYTLIGITEKHNLQLEHIDKEKSEELHQMKLQFFTNISHEFRTPLSLIVGPMADLLKKDDNEDRRAHYLLIQKNSNYLMRLVNQLIDFRKLDQGKMKLCVAKGAMVDFVRESCDPFQFLANKKNIDYNIIVPKNSPSAWYDADVIEKVMNNILSNAFKFTPENGAITVEMKFAKEVKARSRREAFFGRKGPQIEYVEIRVTDNGVGIENDRIHRIFDRFYNEKGDDGVNPNGSGIGLSFTQSLVSLHHGEIEVESTLGQGSTFIIQFPFRKESYKTSEIVEAESKTARTKPDQLLYPDSFEITNNDGIGETSDEDLPVLLVVDDSADIRGFIKRGLGGLYRIIEADNGESGYEQALEYLPDLIVSDIMMPKLDGMGLLHKLKSDKKTSHIPVLLLTAKSRELNELEGRQYGADGYITKPFRIDLLELRIKNIFTYREQLRKRFAIDVAMQPTDITVTSADEQFIKQAMDIVEDHMMDAEFTVTEFVREMGLSRSNLYSKFKELTGMSTSEFVRSVRLKRAINLLEKSDFSVKEIMHKTGFNTASYFTKCFKKQFGFTPSEYESSPIDVKNIIGKNILEEIGLHDQKDGSSLN